jgi:hypothetical protein
MDGISVPDGDIITHPLSTNNIQIPKAPVVLMSASTLPRGEFCPVVKNVPSLIIHEQ